ncbi:hypothetical protein ACDI96_09150 [Citrobacter telavivensis]
MKAGDKSHPLRTRWTLPELYFLGQRDGKMPTRGIAEYPGTRSGFDRIEYKNARMQKD